MTSTELKRFASLSVLVSTLTGCPSDFPKHELCTGNETPNSLTCVGRNGNDYRRELTDSDVCTNVDDYVLVQNYLDGKLSRCKRR